MAEYKSIMVDFDSTLNQMDERFRVAMKEKYNLEYAISEQTTWDFYGDRFTSDQQDWIWGDECFNNEEFTHSILPHDDAVEGLDYLIANDIIPIVISDRKMHMQAWIEGWLKNLGFPEIEVVITDGKTSPKYEAVHRLELRGAIEDAPHNATAIARKCAVPVMLIDKPWNQNVVRNPYITRVASFLDACELLVERV